MTGENEPQHHRLTVSGDTVQWSTNITDKLMAPRFSALVAFEVPEIEEMPNYHGSLIQNHVWFGLYRDQHFLRNVLNFTRKLSQSVLAYRQAREALQKSFGCLQHSNAQLKRHLFAIDQLEVCILKLMPGLACIWAAAGGRPFKPDDGSDYERLNKIYNRIKHFDEDLVEFEKSDDKDAPIVPIWIENASIATIRAGSSVTTTLSFVELAEILRCAVVDAKYFCEEVLSDARKKKAAREATASASGT